MFVTIRQIQANGANRFQVESGQDVLFQARTPWADVRLSIQAENLRSLRFTDAGGEELFHTEYHVLENALHAASQIKSLFGVSTKLGEYRVIDRGGADCGAFYERVDGALDSRMVIAWRGRAYDGFSRALGKIYVVSIFDGERQIAQLTKPLDTWNRLDVFYLHLDDACRELLPILSFFAIYLDAKEFNRPGKFTKHSFEFSWSYTFDKNNHRYNPNWIRDTFGRDAEEELNRLLRMPRGRGLAASGPSRRMVLLIAAGIIGAAVIIALVFALLFPLTRPKTALTPAEFTQRMEAAGYTVTAGFPTPELEAACIAERDGYGIRFWVFPSTEEAQRAFAGREAELRQGVGGSYAQTSFDLVNSDKYTLTSGGFYSVLARVDNTLLLCTAPEADKDAVRDAVQSLGY